MKIPLSIFIFSFLNIGLYAQKDLSYNSSEGLQGEVSVCRSISLTNGFTFNSASGKSLTLSIDPNSCNPYGEQPSMSSDQNYICTRTYTKDDGSTFLDVIQYFDGLGRPNQTVQVGITPFPNYNDLVSVQEYDGLGRESKAWLLAPTTGNGAYMQNPASIIQSFYNDSAYSRPVYEASPLNRVLEQYGPGKEWYNNAKTAKTEHLANTASGALACQLFKVNGDGLSTSLYKNGNYIDNQLYVTKVQDEDGNTSYEFKDKLGQVVLTRQMNGSNPHDTYYVYDDFGNLSYVIPPMLSDEISKNGKSIADTSTEMLHYAYVYKYDERNRCIWKRLPGCEPIYYVYDKADRLIFSQDGEQRNAGQWTYTLYDDFGRLVVSGYWDWRRSTHDELRNGLKDKVIYCRRGMFDGSEKEIAVGATVHIDYITNLPSMGSPSFSHTSRMANYYDNYDLPEYMDNRVSGLPAGYKVHLSAKGLQTISWEFVDGGELISFMYYDDKGRMVVRNSLNQMGGIDNEYIKYNFTGQPVSRELTHGAVEGQNKVREIYNYTYDLAGRLLETTHSLDGRASVTLAKNKYDELGRLRTTKANNQDNLKVAYDYNIRSWTKSIKSPLFNQDLFYNEGAYTPYYNGNISMIEEGYMRQSFVYDNLSQLTNASYRNTSGMQRNLSYGSSYNYDKHGNVNTLTRNGLLPGNEYAHGIIEDLTIQYNGNQLRNVADTSEYGEKFMDFSDEDIEYTYNRNGALLTDKNKGMTIEYDRYNCFRTPYSIRVDNPLTSGSIYYHYSFSGKKLTSNYSWYNKQSSFPMGGATGQSSGGKATQYVDNRLYDGYEFEFKLEKILLDNGYIDYATKKYYFYLRDHLGNNRIVADLDGNVIQNTKYYPFGLPMDNSTGEEVQPYKYNAKEYETIAGINLYDYHARQHDPILGRFTSIDPLAEKYYSISPYVYCANNPLRFTDPTGMVIDSVDVAQWNNEKQTILNQLKTLVSNNIDGINNDRIASIQGTLGNMKLAEGSTQLYKLGGIDGNLSGIVYDPSSGAITINYGNTANFVHEVTHVEQFESGEIAFSSKNGASLAGDVFDEISAYKAQYNYDPSSVSELPSTSIVSSINDITSSWVQGLDGGTLYNPGGRANTGVSPLSINSSKYDFILSHGIHGIPGFKNMIMGVPLKNYPGVYYKK